MKQRDGNWTRPEGDYFAVKTGLGQIFQGFATQEGAAAFGDTLGGGVQGYEIIDSPWFYEPKQEREVKT